MTQAATDTATNISAVTATSSALARFTLLLRELFQLGDLDLDFGVYRVLNQERRLVGRFLDERLGPIVRDALGSADETQRAALEQELAALAKTLEDAGVAPDSSPKYTELKRQLAALGSSEALEAEVYSGLADFFGRYYDKGDFLSRPRYRRDVYALPYNGEEVKLHWANRDQYLRQERPSPRVVRLESRRPACTVRTAGGGRGGKQHQRGAPLRPCAE